MLISVEDIVIDRYPENALSTANGLVGTSQFIEAKNGNYKGFNLYDLYSRAYSILKIQFYILYQVCLIRFSICHPIAEKFLSKKLFRLSPNSFQPNDEEIILYLREPKFLWRFSLKNYGYFATLFSRYIPFLEYSCPYYDGFTTTFEKDNSPLVPYLKSTTEKFRDNFKLKFNILKSISYNNGIKIDKIINLQNKFHYKDLTTYNKNECFYSDDFQLHLMNRMFNYNDFIQVLITGYSSVGPCGLIIAQIKEANKILNQVKINKKLLRKNQNEIKKNMRKEKKDEEKYLKLIKKLALNKNKDNDKVPDLIETNLFNNNIPNSTLQKNFLILNETQNNETKDHLNNKSILNSNSVNYYTRINHDNDNNFNSNKLLFFVEKNYDNYNTVFQISSSIFETTENIFSYLETNDQFSNDIIYFYLKDLIMRKEKKVKNLNKSYRDTNWNYMVLIYDIRGYKSTYYFACKTFNSKIHLNYVNGNIIRVDWILKYILSNYHQNFDLEKIVILPYQFLNEDYFMFQHNSIPLRQKSPETHKSEQYYIYNEKSFTNNLCLSSTFNNIIIKSNNSILEKVKETKYLEWGEEYIISKNDNCIENFTYKKRLLNYEKNNLSSNFEEPVSICLYKDMVAGNDEIQNYCTICGDQYNTDIIRSSIVLNKTNRNKENRNCDVLKYNTKYNNKTNLAKIGKSLHLKEDFDIKENITKNCITNESYETIPHKKVIFNKSSSKRVKYHIPDNKKDVLGFSLENNYDFINCKENYIPVKTSIDRMEKVINFFPEDRKSIFDKPCHNTIPNYNKTDNLDIKNKKSLEYIKPTHQYIVDETDIIVLAMKKQKKQKISYDTILECLNNADICISTIENEADGNIFDTSIDSSSNRGIQSALDQYVDVAIGYLTVVSSFISNTSQVELSKGNLDTEDFELCPEYIKGGITTIKSCFNTLEGIGSVTSTIEAYNLIAKINIMKGFCKISEIDMLKYGRKNTMIYIYIWNSKMKKFSKYFQKVKDFNIENDDHQSFKELKAKIAELWRKGYSEEQYYVLIESLQSYQRVLHNINKSIESEMRKHKLTAEEFTNYYFTIQFETAVNLNLICMLYDMEIYSKDDTEVDSTYDSDSSLDMVLDILAIYATIEENSIGFDV